MSLRTLAAPLIFSIHIEPNKYTEVINNTGSKNCHLLIRQIAFSLNSVTLFLWRKQKSPQKVKAGTRWLLKNTYWTILMLNYFKIWRYLQWVLIALKLKIKCVKRLGLFFLYLLKKIFPFNVIRILSVLITQKQMT